MSSLLQNIQSKPITVPEKPHGENQEVSAVTETKQDIKQGSEAQKIVKEETSSKDYFNKKTILASLAGLAVLGASVWAVKKYSSKSIAQTGQKLTPEDVRGKIDETKVYEEANLQLRPYMWKLLDEAFNSESGLGNIENFKAFYDFIFLLFGHYATTGQHRNVGDASINIFAVQSLIKANGCVEFLHQLIHVLFKSTTP